MHGKKTNRECKNFKAPKFPKVGSIMTFHAKGL